MSSSCACGGGVRINRGGEGRRRREGERKREKRDGKICGGEFKERHTEKEREKEERE